MPLVQKIDGKPVKPYGVQENTNAKLFQERLQDRFKAHEFVKVINIDDETFIWQYMPQEKEEQQYTPDGMHRHTYRDEPEVWMLDPGESDTIVGANAYVMIDALYKKLTAKKVIATVEVAPGQARAFNFADGTQQDYLIDRILVGKEVPTFTSLNTPKVVDEPRPSEKRPVGRPARQTV